PHARHGRAEAAHLAAHDGRVDDQERSAVLLACRLAHDLEVEADLGMRVEEALLRLLLGDCGLSCAHYVNWAIPHQSLPVDELGLRHDPNANVVTRIRTSLACQSCLPF